MGTGLDYVDPVAVQELVAGRIPPRVTRAEFVEAVRVMTAQGMSARQIGYRVGYNYRTIQRWRYPERQSPRGHTYLYARVA